MVSLIKKNITIVFQTLFLALVIIAYLIKSGPDLGPDAWSYLSFHPMRPPIYPLFVAAFKGFSKYQYIMIMWSQFIITFIALLYAGQWLQRKLNLSNLLTFICLLLTCIIVIFHYKIIQSISTEAIAFTLFIFDFLLLVECFYNYDIKKIILLSIFTSLLILTRAQFYYFYLLLTSLIIWYMWKKISINKIVLTGLILIISIISTMIINRGYHYYMNDHFAEIPIIGTQLIVQPLFLANKDVLNYFENEKERIIVSKMLTQLENNHLTKSSAPIFLQPPLNIQLSNAFYSTLYNSIMYQSDVNIFTGMNLYQKDKLKLHISKKLFIYELKENLSFYLLRISIFFGDISFFISYVIVFFVIGYRLIKNRENNFDLRMIFIFISLLTILINTAFVAIFEPLLPCYSLYSYFLIYCLMALAIQNLLSLHII